MSSLTQALQVMGIGLPVMFGVIILFIVLTKGLLKVFPYKPEEEQEEG